MTYFSNVDPQSDHMMFIGRWCPLHKGHTWIIEQKMAENPEKPILILIRNTSFDEFKAETRAELVKQWMIHNNIMGTVIIIPDIDGVYYGRGVGYNVEEIIPPEDIRFISATEIRKRINENDDSWHDLVAPGTDTYLENLFL